MNAAARPTRTINGPSLAGALVAGIHHLFGRRELINRINVFPVPDGDTGTNLAFTFKAILDALGQRPPRRVDQVLAVVSAAALDGARGNSGAIMAQFLEGCREAAGKTRRLDAGRLAHCCRHGVQQAWGAMSEPVPGTLPSVLEGFADSLVQAHEQGVRDLREQFRRGLLAARESLARTPDQLPVLKQAGVVDAGGQGFVDLLEGIHAWLEQGVVEPLDDTTAALVSAEPEDRFAPGAAGLGQHRFCTECVIEGAALDRAAILAGLQQLDQSSLVVAGGASRVRVHVHVNNPAAVFLACEAYGEIVQQKADDMHRQHGLLNQPGEVAIVTDSGADLPASEAERLGIHIVPVRLSFGGREYIDGVSMQPQDFYRMLDTAAEAPQTSQPPPGNFRRVYELLTAHGYDVLSVGLSTRLSGTTQAARSAAERVSSGRVEVFDTLSASCGQGLLAMVAAEAAAQGHSLEATTDLLRSLQPRLLTMAIPDDLAPAVRGGRVPRWLGRLVSLLHITPVIQLRDGRIRVAGFRAGRGADPASLARRLLKRMPAGETFRILISHADNRGGADEVRRILLAGHGLVHSCHVAETGPALGVHLGRGGLVAAVVPQPLPRPVGKTGEAS
jgi:DegV family protein with EDD domain